VSGRVGARRPPRDLGAILGEVAQRARQAEVQAAHAVAVMRRCLGPLLGRHVVDVAVLEGAWHVETIDAEAATEVGRLGREIALALRARLGAAAPAAVHARLAHRAEGRGGVEDHRTSGSDPPRVAVASAPGLGPLARAAIDALRDEGLRDRLRQALGPAPRAASRDV
jgi:hypothetical protein